jgi:hypothetical protein
MGPGLWLGLASVASAAPNGSLAAGPYVGAVFGRREPVGVSWGLRVSGYALVQGNAFCPNLGDPPIGLGAAATFGLRNLGRPRVTLAAGVGAGSHRSGLPIDVLVEGGLAIGAEGPSFHGEGLVGTFPAYASVRTDPGLGELVVVQGGVAYLGLLTSPGICKPGRPTRTAAGAPREATAVVERPGDERAGTWLDDAGAEGEAVAAFVGLAAELAACGAPAALVGAAWSAAADEVRHTQAAARWAGRFGAVAALALPAPVVRAPDRVRLAVEAFVDGVVGEGLAADEARWAAAHAKDPLLAAHHARIAADEARHAALGGAIVRWAQATGGDEVRDALRPLRDAAAPTPRDTVAGHVPRRTRRALASRRVAWAGRWLGAALAGFTPAPDAP